MDEILGKIKKSTGACGDLGIHAKRKSTAALLLNLRGIIYEPDVSIPKFSHSKVDRDYLQGGASG